MLGTKAEGGKGEGRVGEERAFLSEPHARRLSRATQEERALEIQQEKMRQENTRCEMMRKKTTTTMNQETCSTPPFPPPLSRSSWRSPTISPPATNPFHFHCHRHRDRPRCHPSPIYGARNRRCRHPSLPHASSPLRHARRRNKLGGRGVPRSDERRRRRCRWRPRSHRDRCAPLPPARRVREQDLLQALRQRPLVDKASRCPTR